MPYMFYKIDLSLLDKYKHISIFDAATFNRQRTTDKEEQS